METNMNTDKDMMTELRRRAANIACARFADPQGSARSTKAARPKASRRDGYLSRQSRNQTGGEDKTLPRPCGQFWMIRRFTSAQFVPANAGAKAKNPVGSTLFSTPMVALLRHPGHKILRTSCHESARKRLKAGAVLPLGHLERH